MKRILLYCSLVLIFSMHHGVAQDATAPATLPAEPSGSVVPSGPAPTDNRYDVLGKMFAPFVNILLTDTKNPNHAALLTIVFEEVSGRLPKQFKGATLSAAVQYPDKVKLTAPILGEQATVCRDGDNIWAVPGEKVQFLLKQFKVDLKPGKVSATPFTMPINAQQAVFLPALFTVEDGGIQELNGESCRVLEGGLMPEIAKAVKAEDFRAKVWIAAGYLPRRIEIRRKDFVAVIGIKDLRFGPALTKATWQPPADAKDIFRTSAGNLDKILYVVMNSLKSKKGETPWTVAK